MAPRVVVPDASVLLKWVLASADEENRDRALDLREQWLSGECTLIVPSLWLFEVGNIVGTKQPDLAGELMQILLDYRFEEEPPSGFCLKALELMQRFNVTFYDAAYHAVALSRDGVLVTADANYCRRTATLGHSMRLADWS